MKTKQRPSTKLVELIDENPKLNKDEKKIKGKKKVKIKVTEYGIEHDRYVHLSDSEINKLKSQQKPVETEEVVD